MAPKKKVVKKKRKEEETGPEPERRFFGASHLLNEYYGVIQTDPLGIQTLEGHATYTWPEEEIYYEGPMKESAMTGDGKLAWPDGSTYEGGLVKGQREGQGSLTRADGVTYVGSWKKGVRDGHGRLNYAGSTADMPVYYEGDWLQGKKHGHGKQVWPSGNVYVGDWQQGEMSGYGEMEWSTLKLNEKTKTPKIPLEPELDEHGKIKYGDKYKGTWKKGVPHGEGEYQWATLNVDYEEQQAVNRYQGQWKDGKRHGRGVFIYGDGSRYAGDWQMGKKHGKGKVTFADGTVYEGPFADDRVVGKVKGLSMPIVPKAVLDLGGVDNPLRQTINILDCDGIEFPNLMLPDEEQRATHNLLLEYIAEIKGVYYKYRGRHANPSAHAAACMLKRDHEDMYCMSTLQLWLFFRDHGLVSPKCSYATLNRAINYGQRYYQEYCPDMLRDLNVLAMDRGSVQYATKPKRQRTSKAAAKRSSAPSGEGTELAEPPPPKPPRFAGDEPDVRHDGANQFFADGDEKAPVDDIHADNHQILLRHFFEIIVRVAIVRFNDDEKYPKIHQRVEELVKERIVENFDGDTVACVSESEWIFEHAEHGPKAKLHPYLIDVFSRLGKVTGKFGPDPKLGIDWVSDLRDTPQGIELNVNGVSRRQAHICGHRDDTVHVRDLVKLLKALGFMPKTLAPDELNGTFLFPDLDKDLDDLAGLGIGKGDMMEVQRMTLAPTSGIEGLLGGFTTRGSMLEGFGESGGDALNVLSTAKLTDDAAVPDQDLIPEDAVKLLDFTMPMQEALFIIIDSVSPETLHDLCIDPAMGTPLFTLMDYELTPSEFVRFFYVFAQRRIKGGAGSGGGSQFQVTKPGGEAKRYDCLEKMEPWDVFDLFLEKIFFPAFEQPYPCVEPEEPEEEEVVEEEAEEEGGDTAEAEKLSAGEGSKDEAADDASEEDSDTGFSSSKKESTATPEGDKPREYNRPLWKGFNVTKGARRMPQRKAESLKAPALERRATAGTPKSRSPKSSKALEPYGEQF